MHADSTPETSVTFYQALLHHIVNSCLSQQVSFNRKCSAHTWTAPLHNRRKFISYVYRPYSQLDDLQYAVQKDYTLRYTSVSLRKLLCSSMRVYYVWRILQCQLHRRQSKRRVHIVICIIKITIDAVRNDTVTIATPQQDGGYCFSFPDCCEGRCACTSRETVAPRCVTRIKSCIKHESAI